jgi:hypothetical protein
MATTLNQAVCATNLRNTGYGDCVIDPKLIRMAIRVPKNLVLTIAQLADLQNTINTLILADSKANRIFPIGGFVTPTDNSEDTVFQTMGDGSQVPVRDGNYRWTFDYLRGGLCVSLALRSHNFQNTTWLFVDDKNLLFGQKKLDSTGLAYGLAGVPCLFHAKPWKMATGSTVTGYAVYFDMDSTYLNDYFGFVQADFNLKDFIGLQNIVLQQAPGNVSAAGVFKIQALTGCDYGNMFSLYSTELASSPSLWVLTNTLTGNVITTTSVVADANAKAFTITAASADPDYPASAGDYITVSLAGPTALDTADISGFESISVNVLRG